ncbi:MAG: AMP-binding protein [Pseudomonadota bacterium]|nr:AMP-binding protein [Pseudomonadota bacterium]
MKAIVDAIAQHARQRPQAMALQGEHQALSYAQLDAAIDQLADHLRQVNPRALGLLMDNRPAWVVADLAAARAHVPVVPLPGFFTDTQLQHTLDDAGVAMIWTDQSQRLQALARQPSSSAIEIAGSALSVVPYRPRQATALPGFISKVTYTSGTTGQPKGVCLHDDTLQAVARSLQDATTMNESDRHLCVLPLATLLENLGGLYVPLLAGATIVLPSLARLGFTGSAQLDVTRLYRLLDEHEASTVILTPQILQALVEYLEPGAVRLPALRFVAVGGAPVSPLLLARAGECGLPVFEGYGLSECGSVVAVNTPGQERPGSVGKPLAHLQVSVAGDGELLVRGPASAGYLGETLDSDPRRELATGDLGYLDEDGYLYLTGRKKNLFITSYGRNVAPEWVERELCVQPGIAQAAVFGESKPWNVAVIVPSADSSPAIIEQALINANRRLPDYARVRDWVCARAPFTPANDQYTATGRPRRAAIWQAYADQIEALYPNDPVRSTST